MSLSSIALQKPHPLYKSCHALLHHFTQGEAVNTTRLQSFSRLEICIINLNLNDGMSTIFNAIFGRLDYFRLFSVLLSRCVFISAIKMNPTSSFSFSDEFPQIKTQYHTNILTITSCCFVDGCTDIFLSLFCLKSRKLLWVTVEWIFDQLF